MGQSETYVKRIDSRNFADVRDWLKKNGSKYMYVPGMIIKNTIPVIFNFKRRKVEKPKPNQTLESENF